MKPLNVSNSTKNRNVILVIVGRRSLTTPVENVGEALAHHFGKIKGRKALALYNAPVTPPTYQDAATSGLMAPVSDIETFINQFPHRNFVHTITNPEWTSVCPKTGQPDYATVEVQYVAGPLCIELKAFKMYCQSFRNVGIFYENVVNKVLDDLVKACQPKWMQVTVRMTPRGGISSVLTAEHPDPGPPIHSYTEKES